MLEQTVRELRDELVALQAKFAKVRPAHVCTGVAEQLGEALVDLDGWMGWDDEG